MTEFLMRLFELIIILNYLVSFRFYFYVLFSFYQNVLAHPLFRKVRGPSSPFFD